MVNEQQKKWSNDYYARNRESILQAKRDKKAADQRQGEQERKSSNEYYARNRERILQARREKRVVARASNDENQGVSSSSANRQSKRPILGEIDDNISRGVAASTASKRKRVYSSPIITEEPNEQRSCQNTPSVASTGQSADESELQSDPFDIVYDGLPTEHHVSKRQRDCTDCGAKKFEYEVPSFCCMNGKTELAPPDIPAELLRLFTSQDEDAKKFRHEIRAYNTDLSFASMGVKVDKTTTNMTAGVYTFRANGAVYHKLDQLIPRDGTPRYLQLYFYDGQEEVELRVRGKPNLERSIVQRLRGILANNPYVRTFRSLGELGPLDNYRVELNASANLDQRTYNKPNSDEVAAIWVEGNDNITAFNRSIIIYGRQTHPETIQVYDGCYDPLCYPLFFPNGEHGWHNNIARKGAAITNRRGHNNENDPGSSAGKKRDTVSMLEYYAYKFQIRTDPNLLLLGGRLLQQFGVDTYIKIESYRLFYLQRHQDKIRADLYQGVEDGINAGETQADKIGQRTVLPSSFIGGPRDMRKRYMDAMALVREYGKPDIFMTMTCNPKCDEIFAELLPGQQPQDRPDVVARIFKAKLEALKEQLFRQHVLGPVVAWTYTIEFQKRGLPHAHFLILMAAGSKLMNPDQYDRLVSAEIPDPEKYPLLHKLVANHMLHGPCGSQNPNCPCMQGEPKRCRFHFPKQFSESTLQGDDSYPIYRRRDNGRGVNVRKAWLDNRWVVPYNPKLLMMFNCHLNVEMCSSIKSVKYVFKYVYKGHDRSAVNIEPDDDPNINEISAFQDARWVSPPEAFWRIFGFPMSEIYPSVRMLQIHLPNQQLVRFRANEPLPAVARRGAAARSMLLAFFEKNRDSTHARNYLYKDFPMNFTWDGMKQQWNDRKQGGQVGRLVSVHPGEGERYYLRVLLNHVRGPTSFRDLMTVDGVTHPTFRKATLERGLIETDESLSECLTEASIFQFPTGHRKLFATILVFCEPGDVRKLWEEHYDSMSEDYNRRFASVEQVQNMVLENIKSVLQSMGKDITMFDLPHIDDRNFESAGFREVDDEVAIEVEEEHSRACDSLNPDQKAAFDEIMRHVDANKGGVFFIDGPGGTGKTYLYKALLATVRSRGLIALATASSGAAANNLPGGRTAHSRFKIPLQLENNSMCNIKKQSGAAQLLRRASLLIWDEASMTKRQAAEALDRTMQDITDCNLPFGDKVMVFGGDFRQVLPVVRRGTRAQIVDSSLRMSPLWTSMKKMHLTHNMRARTDPWFSDFLLRIGDGKEEVLDPNLIRVPDDMVIPYTNEKESMEKLIDAIYPSLDTERSSEYMISRAILSTKNEYVDDINNLMIDRFPGEDQIYYSFDSAEDDNSSNYPTEFLNSLKPSGLPPHVLKLKLGCPIILLRNIDPPNGLCNGTRLVCKGFQRNVIDAEIAVGEHAGQRVFLPRIPLCPSDNDMFPFRMKRKQFPIRLSFAMTINKAQGQTIPHVGIYLHEPVFSHGQLYVALSRGTSRKTTKVIVKHVGKVKHPGVYTSNVVYQEVLQNE